MTEADLAGKRLAAVAHSSGAEYLDERHLRYAPFDIGGRSHRARPRRSRRRRQQRGRASVSGLHALQRRHPAPASVLEPAGSPLKKPLDEALVGITASQEWRQIEDGYFGHEQ